MLLIPFVALVSHATPVLLANDHEVGNYPPLAPWMQSQLLNKASIAEDQMQRVLGLREAGNPQLRKGTILEDAEPGTATDDAEFREALRQRQIASVSSREVRWEARNDGFASEGRRATVDRPPPASSSSIGMTQVIVFCSALLVVLLLVRHRAR